MPNEKDPENAIPVVIVPLPFQVFVKTTDDEWTLKASFATGNLAGAWMIGLMSQKIQKVEVKIFEERKGELYEVTDQVVLEAAKVIKKASESGQV
jgi:hypothetical protein